ncbi:MAG: glycogen phosphorylase [Alphaproteobacteria bacterium RIFOXYD12_FULL_60_8]|nr:MAG: glycogen phosphorylase [Alphaproteobacteria bacterium RIFOXYD12_FULL_60_8]
MKKTISAVLESYSILASNEPERIKHRLISIMIHDVGKDPVAASDRDWFYAIAYLLRSLMSEQAIRSIRAQDKAKAKRVYYLSMEYLLGSSLKKNIIDLGLDDPMRQVLNEFGLDINAIAACETDAGLGNGGLGRLAACFLESLATQAYPGFGYGIRYEFGMFTQRIEHGEQVEHPENWLRYGNPWEFERPSVIYPVHFGGRIVCFKQPDGDQKCEWVDTDEVIAEAYDMPISGYKSGSIANLRLWSAKSSRDFDLRYFNEGNYVDAVREKTHSENLSKVLYPNDANMHGQELRLKQEYFFVCASLQDIMRRFMRDHGDEGGIEMLPEKVAIQLNDTHPAMAIAELMRILVDLHSLSWSKAWSIVTRTFAYTNHTLLPEALETWPVVVMEKVLPRHLEIIYRINHEFLQDVKHRFPGDAGLLRRVSLVNDDSRSVRMAYLAVVAGFKVNGVAALHTDLMQTTIFADLAKIFPHKFINQTNGVTPRRWLRQSNPRLAALISDHIGEGWLKDLSELKRIAPQAENADFRKKFHEIKRANKSALAEMIRLRCNVTVNPDALFDVQVKRIHEYKRQLLNLLHVITRYNRIKSGRTQGMAPRVVVIAGKAAPGYATAKKIIHLVNDVADIINNDPAVGDMLKLVFVPNYNVSAAEVIIPGSDLSEQISTAGTEASGTGNMKFALNGALTIGTLDGANIEIREEVGEDNFFLFGLTAAQVSEVRSKGYNPWNYYTANPELKQALDMIGNGYFSSEDSHRYQGLYDNLVTYGDTFMLMADYAEYMACQERVDTEFMDRDTWTRKAVLNVAHMGKFSSDRTIHGYAKDIWGIKSIPPNGK